MYFTHTELNAFSQTLVVKRNLSDIDILPDEERAKLHKNIIYLHQYIDQSTTEIDENKEIILFYAETHLRMSVS